MARLMPTTTAANPIPRMRVALVEETGNVQGVRISRSLASLIFRVRNRVVGSVNLSGCQSSSFVLIFRRKTVCDVIKLSGSEFGLVVCTIV